jgi:hypothetical protein
MFRRGIVLAVAANLTRDVMNDMTGTRLVVNLTRDVMNDILVKLLLYSTV